MNELHIVYQSYLGDGRTLRYLQSEELADLVAYLAAMGVDAPEAWIDQRRAWSLGRVAEEFGAPAQRGGQPKNQNARKSEATKRTGVGRAVMDLGARKGLAVRAARARGLSLKDWVCEAIDEKLERQAD